MDLDATGEHPFGERSLAAHWMSADEARQTGRDLRKVVDHEDHGELVIAPHRPSVVNFLNASNHERIPELLPLRHQRMSVDPFAFFRGSAGLMAFDLAQLPTTGLDAQICGDAHAANFGLYGTHDRRIVMDINDFDETIVGPWEWDLKRLAVSLVLAGRVGGAGPEITREAARHAAKAYRRAARDLAQSGFLDSWTALGDESAISRVQADELLDDFGLAAAKAQRNTSEKVAAKVTSRDVDGSWHFIADPPVLTPVDQATKDAVIAGAEAYVGSLRGPRRHLISRYRPCDVAMRVVGTGSVGLRAYVLLLQGNDREALILQVKQAQPSALAPYLPAAPMAVHEGLRIVRGARLVQVETDPLFGWTTIGDTPYVVRQFRNRKGEIDPTVLSAGHLDDYGRLAGALLARAHGRSLDPRVLAGYAETGRRSTRRSPASQWRTQTKWSATTPPSSRQWRPASWQADHPTATRPRAHGTPDAGTDSDLVDCGAHHFVK